MSNALNIDAQRVDELHSKYLEAPKGDSSKVEAFEEYLELQRKLRDEAVARGIDHGHQDAQRIYSDLPDVTDLERAAIRYYSTAPADHLDEIALERDFDTSEALKLALIERYASSLASNAVMRKALAAVNLEWDLQDDPPTDGVLGSALDDVIARLAPYKRRP